MSSHLFNENFDITGDPSVPPYTRREHEIRYELVLPYVKDKTVLDIGCGYGYGSAMLASAAKNVTAIDLNPHAVSKAAERYCSMTNLKFVNGNVLDLVNNQKITADVIVIYEVIEHIQAQEELLHEIWRATAENGRLFLSTPNRLKTPFYRKNPYHIRELSLEEITALVGKWFDIDIVKGQIIGLWSFLPQSFIAPIASKLEIFQKAVSLNDKPRNSMTQIVSGLKRRLG